MVADREAEFVDTDFQAKTQGIRLGFLKVGAQLMTGKTIEAATAVRSDLVEEVTAKVVGANRDRRDAAMGRCILGREPADLIVCLGLGRCMFPSDSEAHACPFCLRYDDRREHTDVHAARVTNVFVRGN